MQSVKQSFYVLTSRIQLALVLCGVAFLLTACSSLYGLGGGFGYGVIAQVEATLRIALIIIGGLLIVAGFAIHKFLIQVIGFIAGGLLGALIGGLLSKGDGWPIFMGFIIGGAIGALLALPLTYLIVFGSGFFSGVILISGLSYATSYRSPDTVLMVIVGIIFGVVMVLLYRFWVTALTASLGSILFGVGTGAPPVLWIVFFIFGIAVQYGLAKVTGRGEIVRPGYTTPGTIPPPPVQPAYPYAPAPFPPVQPYGQTPPPSASYNAPPPQPPAPATVQPPQAAYLPYVQQQPPAPAYIQPEQPIQNMAQSDGVPQQPAEPEKYCGMCGNKIPQDAKYCPRCGNPQS